MSNYRVKCTGCGQEYIYTSSPMIKDEIWESITNEHWKGDKWVGELLCLHCIENRMGRKLKLSDLGDYADSFHDKEFIKRFYNKEKNGCTLNGFML